MVVQGNADDAVRGYGLSALLGDRAAQACPQPNPVAGAVAGVDQTK